MRRFSIGRALADSFGLIGRRPFAVLAWGVLLLLPYAAAMALAFPAFAAIEVSAHGQAETDAFPPEIFTSLLHVQTAMALANLGGLLTSVMVCAAIMRSIVRPAERGWFSLRIGMDELRVLVVSLAILIGVYVVIMIAAMFGVAVGFAAWGGGEPSGGVAAVVVGLVLALVVAVLWGLARLSLIAPATVLRREFAFVEGWRLGRGQGWPLFGLLIVVLLILLLIEIAVIAAAVGLRSVTIGEVDSRWAASAAAESPFLMLQTWIGDNWHWLLVGGLAAAAFYGVAMTLTLAPFASACRQLAAAEPDPQASPDPVA